ncbi:MAG: bifunctional phosphoglucose/phosphomannose isomerase [Candidatus Saccharibacteria bacterium]
MLDDLKLIHERDPQDTLGIAERQWQQLKEDFQIDVNGSGIDNVVYCGMGGSALAALVSTSWPGYNIPFELVRNYDIPTYVSDKTLFIACSYSGNTEEAISGLNEAVKRGARVCVIAGGGKLTDIAKEKGYPNIDLPKAEQPRYAVLYNLKALLAILISAGLVDGQKINQEVESASEFLSEVSKRWQATVPTANNQAKQIALEAAGKSVVIYGGPLLAPAAYKWKISFNENAKQIAWWNQYPEFNHNEFIGWSEQPPIKPYLVVDLRSNLENPRIQKRFELSAKLLSGKRPEPVVVNAEGDNLLKQLLYTIMLGDFTTIYSAILSGVNPDPVDLVEKFKTELDR